MEIYDKEEMRPLWLLAFSVKLILRVRSFESQVSFNINIVKGLMISD